MSLAVTSSRCASAFVDELGVRPPSASAPSLCGCSPELFWIVAREANVSLAAVFAVAGGHHLVEAADKERRILEEAERIARKSRGAS